MRLAPSASCRACLAADAAAVRRDESCDRSRTYASQYATRRQKPMLSTSRRGRTGCRREWDEHVIASPSFVGRRYLDDVPLADIVRYIDWTFFFSAWELKGRFPAILDTSRIRRRRTGAVRARAVAAEAHHR